MQVDTNAYPNSFVRQAPPSGDRVRLVSAGRTLECRTISRFWDQIDIAIGEARVTIDLRDLCLIDGAGLRALVAAVRRLRADGGRPVIRCAPGAVLNRLIEAGLDRFVIVEISARAQRCRRPTGGVIRRPMSLNRPQADRRPGASASKFGSNARGAGPPVAYRPKTSEPTRLSTGRAAGRFQIPQTPDERAPPMPLGSILPRSSSLHRWPEKKGHSIGSNLFAR